MTRRGAYFLFRGSWQWVFGAVTLGLGFSRRVLNFRGYWQRETDVV